MHIHWRSGDRRLSISCSEPGRWEGSPRMPRFDMDHVPLAPGPDRLAVASALLFGPELNGPLHLPEAINIVTASAIVRYCAPAEVFPLAIDDGPKPIESGTASLRVRFGETSVALRADPTFEDRLLNVLPASEFSGALATHRAYSIASNAFLFDLEDTAPTGSIAVAVLVARALGAGVIKVSPASATLGEQERIGSLLSAVGLGLEFETETT